MKNHDTVVVCVTDQKSCVRLINAGAELARERQARIRVLSIQKSGSIGRGIALDDLFEASRKVGADMTVYYHDNANEMASKYLQEYKVIGVVLGDPGNADTGFIKCVRDTLPDALIWLVDARGGIANA